MTSRHIMEVVGLHFKIELFHLSDDAHDQERFRRRQRVPVVEPRGVHAHGRGRDRYQAAGPPRPRSKDWDDARDVIAVQGERIDWALRLRLVRPARHPRHLNEIRRSIPPI